MKSAFEINKNMSNSTGTMGYHRINVVFPNVVLTDGTKTLAEDAECFWLMEKIASYQPKCKKDPEEMLQYMQFWTLSKQEDGTWLLVCERDTNNVFIKEKIESSDFPLQSVKLYVAPSFCGDKEVMVIYLPSEH